MKPSPSLPFACPLPRSSFGLELVVVISKHRFVANALASVYASEVYETRQMRRDLLQLR